MKKLRLYGTILTLTLALVFSNNAISQIGAKGNGNIVKQNREVENFNGFEVGGAFEVYLIQTDKHSLVIETDENLLEKITTEVNNGMLSISSKFIRKATALNIYIGAPDIKTIKISGAAVLSSRERFGVEKLFIEQSGASETALDLNAGEITAFTSGASELELKGLSEDLILETSGASDVDASKLIAKHGMVKSSGASRAKVNVSETLTKETSGSSRIINVSDAEETEKEEEFEVEVEKHVPDDVYVKSMGIEVHEDDDSTYIKIGKHRFVVDENGNVKYKKWKKNKFNGHWAGLDLGINAYLTPENTMNFVPEYDYLDLVIGKSIKVGINFFEQNLPISKNQKWGLITGLGYEINNYRFDNDVIITGDSAGLQGFYSRNISMRKSKLVVNYLEIPVLFEFQTNRFSNKRSFHFTAGMIFGVRVASHTKRYFEELNKEYTLVDPVTGEKKYDATSPNNKKVKDWDDFHLNPFKAEATVRFGWGWINLFGTYSLTTLFKDGKGPELYPFTAGLTISTW